jgi:enoyl-CoA hydratase/carnithine racemase
MVDQSPAEHPVLIEPNAEGTIVTVVLNRPAARNAMSTAMAAALRATLDDLAMRREVRAVIVTGAGNRAFSAGADLVERRSMTPAERTAHTEAIAAAADRLEALPFPTVAAVRGYALAGGAELALACDLRFAADDATFGFPEVRIGIYPGAGGVARLPRLIGPSRARDLLYSGRQVDAEEALRIGLVDRVVVPEHLTVEANAWASNVAENAPLAIRALKEALRASDGVPLADALAVSRRFRRPLDATLDYDEGLRAFAEGRSPLFRGR